MRNIDAYTDFYEERSFEVYQVEFRRKKILEIIDRLKPRKILEIGCGMEPIFKYLPENSYDSMVIVEPSQAFCENAKMLANGNAKVKIYQDFFENSVLKIPDEYDFILCSGLLHEVELPMNLLKAIKQVCSRAKEKKTIVHINVPNANSIHRLIAKEMGLVQDVHIMTERNLLLQQHRVYDLESLREQVKELGFSVLEEGSYFVKFFPHSMMMEMMDKNIISHDMLEGMYKLEKYLPEYGSEIYVNIM